MPQYPDIHSWSSNTQLIGWIEEAFALCQPAHVHLCDGSHAEYKQLCNEMVAKGSLRPLNPQIRPGSYWCHSSADDVARVEEATFICSRKQEDAGPTNNWRNPDEMLALLRKLFQGCMQGRTLYVIPYIMGPIASPFSKVGVQITDSPYVVINMHLMTHVGQSALHRLRTEDFIPCMHSVGVPLQPGQKDSDWPCCADKKYIVHFPEDRSIWSFGSGYGGNALLGKKSLALRIASVMARDEGWMAEHMLILGITNPEGIKKYFVAAFPSQCGKTNLAMIQSSLPGWKVECVGDDIAWMHFGADGRLYAINPETGFFGVAPGTSTESNPNAMQTISHNTIFTNTALTADGDVWWEGMTKHPPDHLMDWHGKPWSPDSKTPAAHPNARFTVSIRQCPNADPHWESPKGVPISAIIFGGRRATTLPLVFGAFNWQHGTFLGASISSETTAAAAGEVGKLRHDPFAMLPFCGYNMGDYFSHWIKIGKNADPKKLPRLYSVNWFRKNKEGKWLWPGFGENMRVLKWIFENAAGQDNAMESPIGYLPKSGSLNTQGLQVSQEDLEELFKIDRKAWHNEAAGLRKYFAQFGSHFPHALQEELEKLEFRLSQ